MPDDTTLATLAADADVYLAASLATVNPIDASVAFGAGWTMLGLLDGGDGYSESRSEDVKDHFAWGGTLVRTSRKNFKLEKKFAVLEDNVTTRALIWPGSSATQRIIPKPANVKIAFETREGGKVQRLITRNYAQVSVDGDIKDGEDDLTKVGLVATIFPDSAGVLFDVLGKPAVVSLALTPLTLAVVTAGANIKYVTATVTYSDATTGDVTAACVWSSSAVSKATVNAGYVTAVAAGTANVTATFAGVTSTAPVVVTVT